MHLARVILAAVLAGLPALGACAQLLVLNKGDATLAFIDPASGHITATASTGEGPHEVEVSSDGRLAFVSNYGGRTPGNTLSVIDIAAHEEVKRADLGELRRPHRLAFSGGKLYLKITPDGRLALVSDLGAGNLLILDAHQYGEIKRLNLGPSPAGILVTPDGATAHVAVTGADRVAVIDLETLSVAKTIDTGHGPDGMAWVR